MGLREKVALLLLAVALKTICIDSMPQSMKPTPSDIYMDNLRKAKTKANKFAKQPPTYTPNKPKDVTTTLPTYKSFDFPGGGFVSANLASEPFYFNYQNYDPICPVQASTDKTHTDLINNLRREAKRKRKNAQIKELAKEVASETNTGPVDHRLQSFYVVEKGEFPEVEYPLSAAETWAPRYWNPIPYNADDPFNEYVHPPKTNTKRKNSDTYFKSPIIKSNNKGLLEIPIKNKNNKDKGTSDSKLLESSIDTPKTSPESQTSKTSNTTEVSPALNETQHKPKIENPIKLSASRKKHNSTKKVQSSPLPISPTILDEESIESKNATITCTEEQISKNSSAVCSPAKTIITTNDTKNITSDEIVTNSTSISSGIDSDLYDTYLEYGSDDYDTYLQYDSDDYYTYFQNESDIECLEDICSVPDSVSDSKFITHEPMIESTDTPEFKSKNNASMNDTIIQDSIPDFDGDSLSKTLVLDNKTSNSNETTNMNLTAIPEIQTNKSDISDKSVLRKDLNLVNDNNSNENNTYIANTTIPASENVETIKETEVNTTTTQPPIEKTNNNVTFLTTPASEDKTRLESENSTFITSAPNSTTSVLTESPKIISTPDITLDSVTTAAPELDTSSIVSNYTETYNTEEPVMTTTMMTTLAPEYTIPVENNTSLVTTANSNVTAPYNNTKNIKDDPESPAYTTIDSENITYNETNKMMDVINEFSNINKSIENIKDMKSEENNTQTELLNNTDTFYIDPIFQTVSSSELRDLAERILALVGPVPKELETLDLIPNNLEDPPDILQHNLPTDYEIPDMTTMFQIGNESTDSILPTDYVIPDNIVPKDGTNMTSMMNSERKLPTDFELIETFASDYLPNLRELSSDFIIPESLQFEKLIDPGSVLEYNVGTLETVKDTDSPISVSKQFETHINKSVNELSNAQSEKIRNLIDLLSCDQVLLNVTELQGLIDEILIEITEIQEENNVNDLSSKIILETDALPIDKVSFDIISHNLVNKALTCNASSESDYKENNDSSHIHEVEMESPKNFTSDKESCLHDNCTVEQSPNLSSLCNISLNTTECDKPIADNDNSSLFHDITKNSSLELEILLPILDKNSTYEQTQLEPPNNTSLTTTPQNVLTGQTEKLLVDALCAINKSLNMLCSEIQTISKDSQRLHYDSQSRETPLKFDNNETFHQSKYSNNSNNKNFNVTRIEKETETNMPGEGILIADSTPRIPLDVDILGENPYNNPVLCIINNDTTSCSLNDSLSTVSEKYTLHKIEDNLAAHENVDVSQFNKNDSVLHLPVNTDQIQETNYSNSHQDSPDAKPSMNIPKSSNNLQNVSSVVFNNDILDNTETLNIPEKSPLSNTSESIETRVDKLYKEPPPNSKNDKVILVTPKSSHSEHKKNSPHPNSLQLVEDINKKTDKPDAYFKTVAGQFDSDIKSHDTNKTAKLSQPVIVSDTSTINSDLPKMYTLPVLDNFEPDEHDADELPEIFDEDEKLDFTDNNIKDDNTIWTKESAPITFESNATSYTPDTGMITKVSDSHTIISGLTGINQISKLSDNDMVFSHLPDFERVKTYYDYDIVETPNTEDIPIQTDAIPDIEYILLPNALDPLQDDKFTDFDSILLKDNSTRYTHIPTTNTLLDIPGNIPLTNNRDEELIESTPDISNTNSTSNHTESKVFEANSTQENHLHGLILDIPNAILNKKAILNKFDTDKKSNVIKSKVKSYSIEADPKHLLKNKTKSEKLNSVTNILETNSTEHVSSTSLVLDHSKKDLMSNSTIPTITRNNEDSSVPSNITNAKLMTNLTHAKTNENNSETDTIHITPDKLKTNSNFDIEPVVNKAYKNNLLLNPTDNKVIKYNNNSKNVSYITNTTLYPIRDAILDVSNNFTKPNKTFTFNTSRTLNISDDIMYSNFTNKKVELEKMNSTKGPNITNIEPLFPKSDKLDDYYNKTLKKKKTMLKKLKADSIQNVTAIDILDTNYTDYSSNIKNIDVESNNSYIKRVFNITNTEDITDNKTTLSTEPSVIAIQTKLSDLTDTGLLSDNSTDSTNVTDIKFIQDNIVTTEPNINYTEIIPSMSNSDVVLNANNKTIHNYDSSVDILEKNLTHHENYTNLLLGNSHNIIPSNFTKTQIKLDNIDATKGSNITNIKPFLSNTDGLDDSDNKTLNNKNALENFKSNFTQNVTDTHILDKSYTDFNSNFKNIDIEPHNNDENTVFNTNNNEDVTDNKTTSKTNSSIISFQTKPSHLTESGLTTNNSTNVANITDVKSIQDNMVTTKPNITYTKTIPNIPNSDVITDFINSKVYNNDSSVNIIERNVSQHVNDTDFLLDKDKDLISNFTNIEVPDNINNTVVSNIPNTDLPVSEETVKSVNKKTPNADSKSNALEANSTHFRTINGSLSNLTKAKTISNLSANPVSNNTNAEVISQFNDANVKVIGSNIDSYNNYTYDALETNTNKHVSNPDVLLVNSNTVSEFNNTEAIANKDNKTLSNITKNEVTSNKIDINTTVKYIDELKEKVLEVLAYRDSALNTSKTNSSGRIPDNLIKSSTDMDTVKNVRDTDATENWTRAFLDNTNDEMIRNVETQLIPNSNPLPEKPKTKRASGSMPYTFRNLPSNNCFAVDNNNSNSDAILTDTISKENSKIYQDAIKDVPYIIPDILSILTTTTDDSIPDIPDAIPNISSRVLDDLNSAVLSKNKGVIDIRITVPNTIPEGFDPGVLPELPNAIPDKLATFSAPELFDAVVIDFPHIDIPQILDDIVIPDVIPKVTLFDAIPDVPDVMPDLSDII